jgi:hypothetical protein
LTNYQFTLKMSVKLATRKDDMSTTKDGAALAECVAPLSEDGRRALRRYWEQVIREEWVPTARPAPRPVSLAVLDERRERRSARRAVARLAAAGRVAQLRPARLVARGGFGPGEAA